MSIFSCLKKVVPGPQKDPLWWTIYSEDGWWGVPEEIAEKMKERLRWRSSGGQAFWQHGGLQRRFKHEYWSVAGCPPCLKKITPVYYDRGEFSHGDAKWYAHDIYWKWPPQ
jgi:hypothetical protein